MLKIKFGVNAIQSGQKSSLVNATPQLLVKSTKGQFTITAPVSKALGIAAGEYVMFLNNIDGIRDAIQNEVPELVQYAEENGIDLKTNEGSDAIIKAFTQWYIAKGAPLFKANGTPIMATVRMTVSDKLSYIDEESKAELIANHEAAADITNDELAKLLTDEEKDAINNAVPSPETQATQGSKTASTAAATGTGLQLNFTDTAIWDSLKADLGEDAEKKNRVFDVKLDEVEVVPFNNGAKEVSVNAYPIEFVEDKEPMVRVGKKASDAE